MKIFVTTIFLFLMLLAQAQSFLEGVKSFSTNEPVYITLKDNKEVNGILATLGKKKKLVKYIILEDSTGNKTEYLPEQIIKMYLPQSDNDRFNQRVEKGLDLTNEGIEQDLNWGLIKNGYTLFEPTEVLIGKNKFNYLLQLLNPGYCSEIKVYFDPDVDEMPSIGISLITISGGQPKSYYIKKGQSAAWKLEKSNYADELDKIYGDLPDYKNIIMDNDEINWEDLAKHILNYTKAKSK